MCLRYGIRLSYELISNTCGLPKLCPALKSAACTPSSTRPFAMTVPYVPFSPPLVGSNAQAFSIRARLARGEPRTPSAAQCTQASKPAAQTGPVPKKSWEHQESELRRTIGPLLPQFPSERRFRYVSQESRHYRGNYAGTESLDDRPRTLIGALGRS
jgi:hypothetical protein